MAARCSDSSTTVSLPSIKEMFPEYMLDRPIASNNRHNLNNVDEKPLLLNHQPSSYRSSSELSQQTVCDDRTLQRNAPSELNNGRQPYLYPPRLAERESFFSYDSHPLHESSGGRYRHLPSRANERPSSDRGLHDKETSTRRVTPPYSNNVLRRNPSTSSLELGGYRPRTFGSDSRQFDSQKGTSPSFRVNLPSSYPDLRGRSQEEVEPVGTPRSFPTGAQTSILSFAFGRAPSGASSSLTFVGPGREIDDGAAFSDDGTEADQNWKVKRHQCPHCTKRFNRPSSLRIHVNTHTGARPFQCPHPSCGRVFNVNSNMRRHYRNHIRSGPSHLRRSASPHPRSSTKRRSMPVPSRTSLGGQSMTESELSPGRSPSEYSGDETHDPDGHDGESDELEEDQQLRIGDKDVTRRLVGNNNSADGFTSSSSASPSPTSPCPTPPSVLRPRLGYHHPVGEEGRLFESASYSHPNIHSRPLALSAHSNSPCKYTASSMYRTNGDNVSTTLRPAFPVSIKSAIDGRRP